MNWNDLVHGHYPQARPGSEISAEFIERLETEWRGDRERTLLATSLCADDINTSSTSFAQAFKGPFVMGGLGGLPFGGLTAMCAYGHHIPDEGTAFIFYGPHIGISKTGELGRMLRPGQTQESNSCGALMLALDRISTGVGLQREAGATFDDDHQQRLLEAVLLKDKEEILSAFLPKKAITDVAYRIIDRQVRELVHSAKDEIHASRVILLGGVIINTDPTVEDFVDIRDFEVLELGHH